MSCKNKIKVLMNSEDARKEIMSRQVELIKNEREKHLKKTPKDVSILLDPSPVYFPKNEKAPTHTHYGVFDEPVTLPEPAYPIPFDLLKILPDMLDVSETYRVLGTNAVNAYRLKADGDQAWVKLVRPDKESRSGKVTTGTLKAKEFGDYVKGDKRYPGLYCFHNLITQRHADSESDNSDNDEEEVCGGVSAIPDYEGKKIGGKLLEEIKRRGLCAEFDVDGRYKEHTMHLRKHDKEDKEYHDLKKRCLVYHGDLHFHGDALITEHYK